MDMQTLTMFNVAIHMNSLFLQDNTVAFRNESNVVCHFCSPGDEYFDTQHQVCRPCTIPTSIECASGTIKTACSSTQDSHCQHVLTGQAEFIGMCGNGVHDFGEQCDSSAHGSSRLSSCCVPDTCKLHVGYYSDPPCSSLCGDGIKTEFEECDTFSDPNCDTLTCRLLRP